MSSSTGSALEAVDFDGAALVVVDLQRAFTSEDSPLYDRGFEVPNVDRIVERSSNLADAARDASLPVVFTRLLRRSDGKDAPRNVYDLSPSAYTDYGDTICLEGNPESEFSEGISPKPEDYEIEKPNQDAFYGTKLDFYLRTEDVDTLIVCGLVSNVCVEGTIRGGHERGYNVVMVDDTCGSYDEEMHEATVRNVEYMFGVTASFESVRSALDDLDR
jgi:ureidoacrylate peracid hydrolase